MALELPQLPSGLAIDVCFLSLKGRRVYPLQDEEGHTAQKAYGRILRAKGTNPHLVRVRTFRAWATCWCLPFFSRAHVFEASKVCVRALVRVGLRACVRACVRASGHVCVIGTNPPFRLKLKI
jgi:hypothetical protein